MKKVNHNILKFIVVLIALFLLEGERTVLYTFCDFHEIISQNHVNDIEVPNQNHHFFDSFEEESWLDVFKFKLSTFQNNTSNVIIPIVFTQMELASSIWQPPKLV
jgi:hypothetical protein